MSEQEMNDLHSFPDLYLPDFKKNNPQCTFSVAEGNIVIERPYGVEDIRFVFEPSDVDLLKDINNIAFLPQFDAVVHVDTNEIEFIFRYLKPTEERSSAYLDRSFDFHFLGQKFICGFREPTKRLFDLAKRYRRLPETGEIVVPQLQAFRDAQRLDKLPDKVKSFFEGRVPRNFFVRASSPILSFDIENLAEHINFHMLYYDRNSPSIIIRRPDTFLRATRTQPRRFLAHEFPSAVAAHAIDDFILQLIEVARTSTPRFAFIYFYQVLEYAGYYFIDEKAKKEIRQFLRDPAMIMCPEEKVTELLSVLSELQSNDETKMRKVIEEFCDPETIWLEIENDKEYFSNPVVFDGGFTLPPLISKDTTLDTWKTMWMPKTFDYLTKIRNCLVHARERRQSHVILPTPGNTYKIERYIPVIIRLVEQIALSKI